MAASESTVPELVHNAGSYEQLPMSAQQSWLWDVSSRQPAWNCILPYPLHVAGPLDAALLKRSIVEIAARHAALRTTVVSVDGVAMLRIDAAPAIELTVTRVRGPSTADRFNELLGELIEGRRELNSPLARITLLQLAPVEHLLVFEIHRLLADCASIEQLIREIWSVYADFGRDQPSALSAAPLQYSDYAIWQHSTRNEWQRRHEGHWAQHLLGATCLQWPDNPAVMDRHRDVSASVRLDFRPDLSIELEQFSRKLRSLPSTVALSVYVAVLYHWCRQSDFVVAFNIAGRQSEHKSVVGYFSQIVYLRIKLSAADTFSQLLARVNNEFFQALSHQDFGRMVARRPELLSGTFFQWVTWHSPGDFVPPSPGDLPAQQLDVKRLPFREFEQGLSVTPPGLVNLELTFFDTPEGIRASAFYRADRFSAITLERFMAQLQTALQAFIRDPHSPILFVAG